MKIHIHTIHEGIKITIVNIVGNHLKIHIHTIHEGIKITSVNIVGNHLNWRKCCDTNYSGDKNSFSLFFLIYSYTPSVIRNWIFEYLPWNCPLEMFTFTLINLRNYSLVFSFQKSEWFFLLHHHYYFRSKQFFICYCFLTNLSEHNITQITQPLMIPTKITFL